MIDIENIVFNTVATALRAQFQGISVYGEYVPKPASFPCATLIEMGNAPVTRMESSGGAENFVSVMYEANAYSNKSSGKKAQSKNIMAIIDTQMLDMGFTRTFTQPIENVSDQSVYRIVARYTAVVSKNKTLYRR